MASNLVLYTDNKWVIDICQNLAKEVEQNSHDDGVVSVSQVPKSLRSSNPESFIPQFVGLGPYHHYKSDLIMTKKLKLDSSKRALKHFFHQFDTKILQQRLESILSYSQIQAFYHIDVTSKYNYQTLLYILNVDCLFLLGLLHRVSSTTKAQQEQEEEKEKQDSHFLTGKHGIAMVNSSGVELTMDFIIRDVFMLENQIPTYFLKQVQEAVILITSDEIESPEEEYKDIGSTMKKLCESICPFVHEFQLSKNPEDHEHLLDLMYHLIVFVPKLKVAKEKDDPNRNVDQAKDDHKDDDDDVKLDRNAGQAEDDHKDDDPDDDVKLDRNADQAEDYHKDDDPDRNADQAEDDHKDDEDVELDRNADQQKQHLLTKKEVSSKSNTCFSVCSTLLVYIVVACMIIGFIIRLILTMLFWILKTLFRFIKWALSPLVKLLQFIYPYVEELYDFLYKNQTTFSFIKPMTKIVGEIKKTSEDIGRQDYSTTLDNNNSTVIIRSVTELQNAGIKFKPADNKSGNGISSIDFVEIKCQFILPIIKLDMNSEVLIRNLMAYESLIKSEGLIFTRYMELMRAIIDTPEDVKILINEKIIQTELSHEAVADLFNGLMGKSIRPTKVQKLDQVIKRVNGKFESTQAQKTAMIKYMSSYGKMLTAFAAIVFLVLTIVQTYCSVFGCARNSNFSVSSMHQDGEYVRNASNIFMSSSM